MTSTCKACDSMEVLDQLVRSGIWSKPDSIFRFKRVVLDVDSIVLSLYRYCISNHLKRLKSIRSPKNQKPDLYSATLVNYTDFARLVKQLLDYFQAHKIEPIVVYAGKPMEAPLFGLLAAEFTKNTQKVVDSIKIVNDYDKKGLDNYEDHNLKYGRHLGRPNLALIIFKSIVNIRRRTGAKIHVFQAFYSPYPQMAKLARDNKCPVITSNGDFIIMDVRAGFVLFEEFWSHHIEQNNVEPKSKPTKSPKSAGGRKSPSVASSSDNHVKVDFHFNLMFLHQHPGLNAALAMNLFPLTTVDFVTKYGVSLKKLKIFDTEYKEKDFMPTIDINGKSLYKKHHLAANRLEMVLSFLCGKTFQIMGNLVRGEATRTNTSFDDDFRNLFNFHAVAYGFKHRLRFALKYIHDPVQLNYIEWCLVNRECTADYLLDLLCCSIGRLACVSYNKNAQFEDLKTKHSAYWLKNHAKSMLMSLFTANKSHKGEHSVSLSNKQQDTVTRYSTASLTIVDRQKASLVEFNLATTHESKHLDGIRDKLQLADIAHLKTAKQNCVKFINLAFESVDITQLPSKLETLLAKYLGKDEHSIKNELAIMRSLSVYSQSSASTDDSYFKGTYSPLFHPFEIAIMNHYLYLNEVLSRQKQGNLSALVDLVNKLDLENVAHNDIMPNSSLGSGIKSTSSIKSDKSSHDTKRHKPSRDELKVSSKCIRHLIELLSTSIEAYCELNAFFNYPLPKLNISLHYNPILLYNLTMLANHKALIKF